MSLYGLTMPPEFDEIDNHEIDRHGTVFTDGTIQVVIGNDEFAWQTDTNDVPEIMGDTFGSLELLGTHRGGRFDSYWRCTDAEEWVNEFNNEIHDGYLDPEGAKIVEWAAVSGSQDGSNGVWYATRADVLAEYNVKILTRSARQRASGLLDSQAKTYHQWAEGEVYDVAVYDMDDEYLAGCGGYLGYDGNELLPEILGHIEEARHDLAQRERSKLIEYSI